MNRSMKLFLSLIAATIIAFLAIVLKVGGTTLQYLFQGVLIATVIYVIGKGAEWMVEGSVRIARLLGVSYLMIGLTVVAFGTSAPELAASIIAAAGGSGDISISNVIGSNIFNLCFILGGVALLTPGGLPLNRPLVFRDGPIILVGTIVLFLIIGGWESGTGAVAGLLDFTLSRVEAILLCLALGLYLYRLYKKREVSEVDIPAETDKPARPLRDTGIFLFGLGLVLGGCHLLVGHWEADGLSYGALWFAHTLNIPDYIIGGTVVAAGTSAPELVVSLAAALRKQVDISTGNLLGSAIFNIFGVVGVAGLIIQPPIHSPITLSPDVSEALISQCALLVIITIFMFTERRLSRLEGAILVLVGIAHWVFEFATGGHF